VGDPDDPDIEVGQTRLNVNNQRLVRVVVAEWIPSSRPSTDGRLEVCVADLLDDRDTYWIKPRRLGRQVSEMEALVWAARADVQT
jgi:hypothetical protein